MRVQERNESMRLILPPRNDIVPVHPKDDPMRFYYWPVLGWFYRQRLQMIMELLGEGRYGNLLEVAYGSGILMPSLATVSESLHGIDLHDKLDLVYETLRRANVRAELRSGDALSMPYSDNSFDCVVNVST